MDLEYEPQVAGDGSLRGFEAFARWHVADTGSGGLEKLPSTELGDSVWRWTDRMLDRVLRQQAAWRKLDSPVVRVSINIDAGHLSRSDFADLVFGALSRHQVRAEYLSLEIAEATLTADLVDVALMLHTLRQRGVHIALDNFGTDWTRLDRLVKLPIDALKLDRSFVRQIGTDRKWQSVASAVVKLAAMRRLEVIAEGVEQPEQLALLTSFGVNAFQGSLFHLPASADHWTSVMHQPRPTLSGWESTATMALFEDRDPRERPAGGRPAI